MDPEASTPPPAQVTAPRADQDRPARPWGPRQVLLGVLAVILIVTFEAAIVSAFDPGLDSVAAKLVLQALLSLTLVGVAFAFAAPDNPPAAVPLLGLRRPGPGAAKLAVTAYAVYFAFALAYSLLVSPHQKDLTRDLGYGDSALASLVAGLLVVLVAPVCEEIFFRGFVFGGLRSRLSFAWAALVSAAIFGAATRGRRKR